MASRVSLLLVAAGLAGGTMLVALDHGRWLPLVAAALAVCLVTTWILVTSGILHASKRRAVIAGQEGMQQWLRFALAAALVWWIGPYSSAAMAGYGMAAVCVLAFQRWFLRRTLPAALYGSGQSVIASAWEGWIKRYAWPFAIWGAALSLQLASSRCGTGL